MTISPVPIEEPEELPDQQKALDDIRSLSRHLHKWQRQFAKWYAHANNRSKPKQIAKIKELSGYEITEAERRELCVHPVFREYVKLWKEANIPAAKTYLAEMALPMAKLTYWAAKKAQKEGDYRAIPAIADVVLKKTMPIHGEGVQATSVNIVLSAQQMAALDAQPIEVTFEKVEPATDDE